jgi:hypothetical protein
MSQGSSATAPRTASTFRIGTGRNTKTNVNLSGQTKLDSCSGIPDLLIAVIDGSTDQHKKLIDLLF